MSPNQLECALWPGKSQSVSFYDLRVHFLQPVEQLANL